MFCNLIEEYSIRYLEDDLDGKEKMLLTSHINKCKKCRMMFNVIRNNYHPEAAIPREIPPVSAKVSARINNGLDGNRYPVSKAETTPFTRRITVKRVILVAAVIAISIFTMANAKGIYKTYKELVNLLFVDRALFGISGTQDTWLYDDEEYVKGIYEEYEDEVNSYIAGMDTAEISRLKYDVDGKTFRINIAKGVAGNFISYGFEGYKTFENDFARKYTRAGSESILNNRVIYNSIDELKSASGICPVPGYIPRGFDLAEAAVHYMNPASRIIGNVGMKYEQEDGEFLIIALTRNKVAVNGASLPGELAYAGWIDLAQGQSQEGVQSQEYVPGDVIEAADINGCQALYLEQPGRDSQENGEYKVLRSINMYLGDGAKLPILRVESSCLQKDELVRIAENVAIEQVEQDEIRPDEYFRGIEDGKVLAFAGEYLENIKAGKSEFKIKVDKDTEFYKDSRNDTYYITYNSVDITKVNSYVRFPFTLDAGFLKQFEHARIQVTGRPYSRDTSYWCGFARGRDTLFSIRYERVKNVVDESSLADLLIGKMRHTEMEAKPFFSKSGHLYYLIEDKIVWIIDTMYEVDGVVYNYFITVQKEVFRDEEDLLGFLDSLR